jgi:hypothetical protein
MYRYTGVPYEAEDGSGRGMINEELMMGVKRGCLILEETIKTHEEDGEETMFRYTVYNVAMGLLELIGYGKN